MYYLRLFLLCFSYDTPPTDIFTLSLHDALPISGFVYLSYMGSSNVALLSGSRPAENGLGVGVDGAGNTYLIGWSQRGVVPEDRKSTRLNSSHANISYAVFCLKKKKANSGRYTQS